MTAPLYLCRSCGADALRFQGEEDSQPGRLTPNASRSSDGEWLLYDRDRLTLAGDDEESGAAPTLAKKQMKERPVLLGTFDPETCNFAPEGLYPVRVALAPARNTCRPADPPPTPGASSPRLRWAPPPPCGSWPRDSSRDSPSRTRIGPDMIARSGCSSSPTADRMPPTKPASSPTRAGMIGCAAAW
ncbi:hypothetical protein ACN28S_19950 [Cystobacter fuscus]